MSTPVKSNDPIYGVSFFAQEAWKRLPRELRSSYSGIEDELGKLGKLWEQARELPAVKVPKDRDGLDAASVGRALTAVKAYASEFHGNDLWASLQDVHSASRRVQGTATSLAGEAFWKPLAVTPEWRASRQLSQQHTSASYARLAAALADQMEPETPRQHEAVAALRGLEHAAAGYAANLMESDPQQAPAPRDQEIAADLARMKEPHPAYRSQQDTRDASQQVKSQFTEWEKQTALGRAARSSRVPQVVNFVRAWDAVEALGPVNRENVREAAKRYGRLASTAHVAGELARGNSKISPRETGFLDAIADAAHGHSARLANTLPPRIDPKVQPYESSARAFQDGQKLLRQFEAWASTTEMGNRLRKDPRFKDLPEVRAFGESWRGTPAPPKKPVDYDQWSAATVFRTAADRTYVLMDMVQRDGSFKDADVEQIRQMYRATESYAKRLAPAERPKSVVPTSPALVRRKAQEASASRASSGAPAPLPASARTGVAGPGVGLG